jgi:hypothetical protein
MVLALSTNLFGDCIELPIQGIRHFERRRHMIACCSYLILIDKIGKYERCWHWISKAAWVEWLRASIAIKT